MSSLPVIPQIKQIICPNDVISGQLITKDKRQEIFGCIAGGAGSRKPEEYQRLKIEEGTGVKCAKTHTRINLRTNKIENIPHPNTFDNGFDYSEDFDGVQEADSHKIYVNLKCIVGKGGAQTRSLREVYWFVEGQLHVLKNEPNVYFANILDGDEAHHSFPKFNYLLTLPDFQDVSSRVYVGDLHNYFGWYSKITHQTSDSTQI